MDTLLLTAVLSILVAILYLYRKWALNYWHRKGLEIYDKKIGNLRASLDDAYNEFRSKGLRHGGLYALLKPLYVVVDLELVKTVMQKDFDHFVNHGMYVNEKADPLSAHLFNIENEKWRNLRTKLTPTFTSGKMKMMYQTIIDCTVPLVDILKQNASLGDPVDIKDLMARFTTDIIGSVAFGVDCNSLKDPNCKFREVGREITRITWRTKFIRLMPRSVLLALNFRGRTRETENFFMDFVKKIVDYRETNNIYRKDFMHMMLQLKNRGKTVDDEKIMEDNKKGDYMKLTEIAAQCFVFFIGGFDTSSTLMTFALLELAQHQDIQDRLREEMKTVIKKHGGITYDAIMEMTYLDQVVNESLRVHPPAFATNRRCNKNFIVPGTNVEIEKGTPVIIPINGIHHDPEYYSEPQKFDPERFSPENRGQIPPFAFIPFGEGPRMCIGARFGLLQSKVGLTAVLTNFKVTLNSKTIMPIQYDHSALLLSAKGDIWLNMTKV